MSKCDYCDNTNSCRTCGLTYDDGVKDGKKTVTEVLEEVCAEICNKYCKYPDMPIPEGKTEDWLLEEGGPCDTCPMNRIQ